MDKVATGQVVSHTIEDTYKEDSNPDTTFDDDLTISEKDEKRLLRKLDLYLIPWLSLLYLVSFLDRTNVGNAKIAGLQKDLHLTDGQFSAGLCIFFVSYSVFEPMSNLMLRKLRPRIYIPTLIILWGICCVCQGLVKNFAGFAAVRWFLGLFEAGLFPGINFYLSCWYKRQELGFRAAIFFSAAALAGAFGGLLAAAIGTMHGLGGKAGWAWIFIIEGLVTVVIGFMSFYMVQDFPEDAKFLSNVERAQVQARLSADKRVEREPFRWAYVKASLQDWKTYTSATIYMGLGGGLYAFSLFLPTILAELGYKTTKAQLLSVPPYAAAVILTVAVGYVADRTKRRGLLALLLPPLGIVGFIMLLASNNPRVKYAATFLAAMGIYPCIPNTIVWVANNTEGVYKRGVTLGLAMGWANLQGVIISNIYRSKDAPRFIPGHATVTAYLAAFLLGGSILHYILLSRENKKRRAGGRDYRIVGKSEQEVAMLGDQRPDFIYEL